MNTFTVQNARFPLERLKAFLHWSHHLASVVVCFSIMTWVISPHSLSSPAPPPLPLYGKSTLILWLCIITDNNRSFHFVPPGVRASDPFWQLKSNNLDANQKKTYIYIKHLFDTLDPGRQSRLRCKMEAEELLFLSSRPVNEELWKTTIEAASYGPFLVNGGLTANAAFSMQFSFNKRFWGHQKIRAFQFSRTQDWLCIIALASF